MTTAVFPMSKYKNFARKVKKKEKHNLSILMILVVTFTRNQLLNLFFFSLFSILVVVIIF